MGLWTAPGVPQEFPAPADGGAKDQDDETDDTLTAPLHPSQAQVTTSGSVRPVAGKYVVYARPDEEKKKSQKRKSDMGLENPNYPIGMGTAPPPISSYGDGVSERQDFKSGRKKLYNRSKKHHTEWSTRNSLKLTEGLVSKVASKLSSAFGNKSKPNPESELKLVTPTVKSNVGQRIMKSHGSVGYNLRPRNFVPPYESEAKWIRNKMNSLDTVQSKDSGAPKIQSDRMARAKARRELKANARMKVKPSSSTGRLQKVIGTSSDMAMPKDQGRPSDSAPLGLD